MILLALALAAAPEPQVVVSTLQTESLAAACRGKDDDLSASFCTGYILAAFDTLSLSRQICPSPKRASSRKAVAAARKYLRTRPESWSSAPAFVLRDALTAAFPCKKR